MEFRIVTGERVPILHYHLDRPLRPEDLQHLDLPWLDRSSGLILSGRGPMWLIACLVHRCHPHPFLAVYDPRLAAAVVVETHRADGPEVGSLLPITAATRRIIDA